MTDAKLTVREAATTSVVDSFTILSSDLDTRNVPAQHGIYFAICVVAGPCHAPHVRLARPATAYLPRRIALELALRTFLETSARLVAVSLPTRDYTILLIERDEVTQDARVRTLARTLRRNPGRVASWSKREIDGVTRPRVFAILGLEPTPAGGETLAAVARWPEETGASQNIGADG